MITNIPIVGKVAEITEPVEEKTEFHKIKVEVNLYYISLYDKMKEFRYSSDLKVSDLSHLISIDTHIPGLIDDKISEALQSFYKIEDGTSSLRLYDTKSYGAIYSITVSLYGFNKEKQIIDPYSLPEKPKNPMDIYIVPGMLDSITYTINPIYNKKIVNSRFIIFNENNEKCINTLDIYSYRYQLSKSSVYDIGDTIMKKEDDGNKYAYIIDELPYYNDIVWKSDYTLTPCTRSKYVSTLEDYFIFFRS